MSKLLTLGAGAIGYVLGSRAGRKPYDTLVERGQQVRSNPRVQDRVQQAKQTVQSRVSSSTSTQDSSTSSNPTTSASDSGAQITDATDNDTVGVAGTGPQGTLP